MSKAKLWRGFAGISVLGLSVSVAAALVMEKYGNQLDQVMGTKSSKVVSEETEDEDEIWTFDSEFTSAKVAYETLRDANIRQAAESFTLLKNENSALPLAKNSKVTLLGVHSVAPIYGNSMGSIPDQQACKENSVKVSFEANGLSVNPNTYSAYEKYCENNFSLATGVYADPAYGYNELYTANEINEPALTALDSSYKDGYSTYSDAAIVIVGRPGGESTNFYLGADGIATYSSDEADGEHKAGDPKETTTTGNIMGLSTEEKAAIAEAKANFDKVIVLINSTQTMEFKELRDDPDIDAIGWIGYPGPFGFHGVAQVLTGEVNASGHLGDVLVTNAQATPAMQNFGNIPWANASDFTDDQNVNSYLVNAEGIYTGYRYYETRYADIVGGVKDASKAKAGQYTVGDGIISTSEGTWDYSQEVIYPFGHGLSYTSFEQTLDSVEIKGDHKTAIVKVTVKNIGEVEGKDAVELYAQTPYTDYDKQYGVEKSAIQLMDYEKTNTLKAGESQTIEMEIDMSNIASYDYTNAKTFITDAGTYYFALGDSAHDALNNVLAAQGKSTSDGMTSDGDASKTYSWTWDELDAVTFSYEDNREPITNKLSEGDYATDLNYFMPDTVTYMTRSDWYNTFPKTYSGLSANDALKALLDCDVYELQESSTDELSELKWGDTISTLKLADLKFASWDDERYDELVDKATIAEFISFASSAFHNIAGIDSVGLLQHAADDGPGGSDSHKLGEGTYRGVAWSDASEYANYSTRICAGQTNIAYTWNKELAYEEGKLVIGESSLIFDCPIMIGPSINLHRHGYNGRGGEYLSEDPILSGYTGSALVQGAQSKGCLVNLKHFAFNDQEINRSGVCSFQNEQSARELELRNFRQAILGKGKPASFKASSEYDDTYTQKCLGVMTSYNRIGAVAPSANKAAVYDILRTEWGFTGYNVTDFTGVSLKAMPKESILYGTVAFCGFGGSVSYFNEETLSKDATIGKAIKQDLRYILYSCANSNLVNGLTSSSHTVQLMSSWRILYTVLLVVFGAATLSMIALYIVDVIVGKKKEVK